MLGELIVEGHVVMSEPFRGVVDLDTATRRRTGGRSRNHGNGEGQR
jgi:hypothetical protein